MPSDPPPPPSLPHLLHPCIGIKHPRTATMVRGAELYVICFKVWCNIIYILGILCQLVCTHALFWGLLFIVHVFYILLLCLFSTVVHVLHGTALCKWNYFYDYYYWWLRWSLCTGLWGPSWPSWVCWCVGTCRPSLLRSAVVSTASCDGEHCAGMGWSMRAKLTKLGVETCEDLQTLSAEVNYGHYWCLGWSLCKGGLVHEVQADQAWSGDVQRPTGPLCWGQLWSLLMSRVVTVQMWAGLWGPSWPRWVWWPTDPPAYVNYGHYWCTLTGEHCVGVGWSVRSKLTTLGVVTYRPSLLRSTMVITDV